MAVRPPVLGGAAVKVELSAAAAAALAGLSLPGDVRRVSDWLHGLIRLSFGVLPAK
jgi:hypothetical protein